MRDYWNSERPQKVIGLTALLLFLALVASAIVVPNLPYKARYGNKPVNWHGRECGECGKIIEGDVLLCPHCGH